MFRTPPQKELYMGSKDKASNKAQDLKGKVKESVGSATGNEDLRRKGKTDQTKAALKDSGEKLKDAGAHVRDMVKDR
jgi:uncharacterized protein YjbJ (UPF0337 family)